MVPEAASYPDLSVIGVQAEMVLATPMRWNYADVLIKFRAAWTILLLPYL